MAAIAYLQCRCDGAIQRDGEGFSGADVSVGTALSRLDNDQWDDDVVAAAYRLAWKHRGQLTNASIDVQALPAPAASDIAGRRKAVANACPTEALRDTNIDVDWDRYLLSFRYHAGLNAIVRDAGGYFDSGRWVLLRGRVAAQLLKTTFLLDRAGRQVRDAVEADLVAPIIPPGPDVLLADEGESIVVHLTKAAGDSSGIEAIPGSRFDRSGPCWVCPADQADRVVHFARRVGLVVDDPVAALAGGAARRGNKARSDSQATRSNLKMPAHLADLRPFQRAGVAYALKRRRVLIGDQVGLGETAQALAILALAAAYPAVIVCPAPLKSTWVAEAARWIPTRRTAIVAGTKQLAGPDVDVVIVNYDLIATRLPDLVGLHPKAVVVDECHSAKNPKAKRTRALHELAAAVPDGGIRLGLSGTAILNRPVELVEQLRLLGRFEDVAGTFWRYTQRYCEAHYTLYGRDVSGASNLLELHDRLRETCYVRPSKSDVIADLPDVQHASVLVEMSPRETREYALAESDVIAYLVERAQMQAEAVGSDPVAAGCRQALRASAAEPLVRLTALREIVGRAKLAATIAWVVEWLAGCEEKMILFAWHKSLHCALVEATSAVALLGGESPRKVEAAKRRFQTDPDTRLIVCSLQAASEGHTLTAASAVTLAELPWTPARIEQAVGRAYGRLSDARGVTAYRILAANTIDDDLSRILYDKEGVVEALLDGKSPVSKRAVWEALVLALLEPGRPR